MSSVLVQRDFSVATGITFKCWIVRIVNEQEKETFWFKGHDAASFLGYIRPNDAIASIVKPKWKQTWSEIGTTLKYRSSNNIEVPAYWKPHSVFISEPGLYALITRSKLPIAEQFTDWIYEEVLPTLRQEGVFKIKNEKIEKLADGLLKANQALIQANSDLMVARQDAVVLSHRLADIAQDVIAKPHTEQLLHALTVHELEEGTNEIMFTRCQRRSLTNALKRLTLKNPNAIELYRTGYVPNGINVLNCLKEYLKKADIRYKAKNNIVKILNEMNADEIIYFVRSMISSNRQIK